MSDEINSAVFLAQQLAKEMETRAETADKTGELPAEDVILLKRSGYLGLSVPKTYGGQGLSLLDCVAAQVELAQGSASTAMVAGMQLHIFGHQREVCTWRAEAYEWLCWEAAQGALCNFVASEPEMGSPSRGGLPGTTAVATPNGWLVNGRKTWSTGGKHLDYLLVRVNVAGENGVIVVPKEAPGIEWQETWSDSLSLRASDSHDVYFHDVLVPQENLIERGDNKVVPNLWFPLIMSAVYLGTAVAARNCVIQFVLERVPTALGKPIATLPKIQRQIGEMDVALQAARALMFEVAGEWMGDETEREKVFARITAVKTLVTETANQVTDKALQIAGGSSITKALPLERFFRDVRAGSMQPPAGDTALEIIGQAAINEISDKRLGD